jgi:hypothetical protein
MNFGIMIRFFRILNVALSGKISLLILLMQNEEMFEIKKDPKVAEFISRLAFSNQYTLSDNDMLILEDLKGKHYCNILKMYYEQIN